MNVVCATSQCPVLLDAKCVFYEGEAIIAPGIDTNDNMEVVVQKLAAYMSELGTVTDFSAGNLSPLFTTNVATSTTTPALTFTLVNQNANLVYAGPATGVAAAPTFRALVAADIPALPYQGTLNLTTTGSSGAATLIGNTLNIPQYSGGGGTPGGVTTELQLNNAGAFGGANIYKLTNNVYQVGNTQAGGIAIITESSDLDADLVLSGKDNGNVILGAAAGAWKSPNAGAIEAGHNTVILKPLLSNGGSSDSSSKAVIEGGESTGSAKGGKAEIRGGSANSGAGGDVLIQGGSSVSSTIGDVTILGNTAIVTNGTISITLDATGLKLTNIPSSSAGLPSGYIWSNAGVLTKVP